MTTLSQGRLRAAFARRLSEMYAREVPAYQTLLDVSHEVNAGVVRERGEAAERLGSIGRVTEERHGAIRVGTPGELRAVARIFGALGMHPVGFYDLREAAVNAVPVVSTAFRPLDAAELAVNPFRVFTSMLATSDARFFDEDLRPRLENFLARRQLFPPELLALADRAERDRELSTVDAERFLTLAVGAFELSTEPVDRAWYEQLERVSAVAADIGGVRSTHVNHLTPRVLDIDELYRRMSARGIEMIDTIQGPPRWAGPDVLLRQTSFRALAEPRTLREPDGTVGRGALRVRFGEVEARGIALTRTGRARYDELLGRVEDRLRADPGAERAGVAREIWAAGLPDSERGLFDEGLAFCRYELRTDRPAGPPPGELSALIDHGWVRREPIVYEDFLPRSAAGIFQSNLTGRGTRDDGREAAGYDLDRLAGILGREVHDPFDLYARRQDESAEHVFARLRIPSTNAG
ncbi:VOC family protein [Amycolatopsis rhabdoformis]|uniref:2-oxoadipate dioxygenase/decarboxylase n=1 Tax=Amycolatopsis rhabdoformis TaxID=1448059 RepID=A0ABZ1IL63_9PSEU|nr:VOC family protein [Amycolatopsis rhabdoformis]WSE34518.1 VOC family protein [Amycolatopsis rhabdoformis]